MKVTEYQVVAEPSTSSLQIAVNKHIQEGYQPWGSMRIINNNVFIQTMVKYEEVDRGKKGKVLLD